MKVPVEKVQKRMQQLPVTAFSDLVFASKMEILLLAL
jgi:hypothetical protein